MASLVPKERVGFLNIIDKVYIEAVVMGNL